MKIAVAKGCVSLGAESAAELCQLEFIEKDLQRLQIQHHITRQWSIEGLTIFTLKHPESSEDQP